MNSGGPLVGPGSAMLRVAAFVARPALLLAMLQEVLSRGACRGHLMEMGAPVFGRRKVGVSPFEGTTTANPHAGPPPKKI